MEEVERVEPSRWLEFGWEWEIFGWEEWESGSGRRGQMGVCSVLRVAAPGGEKHLLTMQKKKKRRKKFRIEGSNEFSCEGSNI